MLRPLILASALSLLAAGCGGGGSARDAGESDTLLQPAPEIQFTTILRGSSGGVPSRRQMVARTQAEWEEMWTLANQLGPVPVDPASRTPLPPAPAIDFTTKQAIGVFMGSFASGGHATSITRIAPVGGTIVVHYREEAPPPGAIVTQAFEAPVHLVTIPASPDPVVFQLD